MQLLVFSNIFDSYAISRSSNAVHFLLQVTDTNDNPPVFPENAYSFDIPENTIRGTRVGEITATDEDEGLNGQVNYQVISDWANDVFSLNPQTGVFTLTARLDYEEVRVKYKRTFQGCGSGWSDDVEYLDKIESRLELLKKE